VFEEYGTQCWLCGGAGADTVDHIIPRSRGGELWDLDNCRPAHRDCNLSRRDRPPARRGPRQADGTPYPAPSRTW